MNNEVVNDISKAGEAIFINAEFITLHYKAGELGEEIFWTLPRYL